jgi:uncharacterized OsmC-like protein
MTIKVYPEKMVYLQRMLEELPNASNPSEYRTSLKVDIEWLEGNFGRTRLGETELVSDERVQSTGFGHGPSPAHYFLAGFGFAYVTQWGRASAVLNVPIESLRQSIHAWFDRRGEYLYELGWPHNGFEEITLDVQIESRASREQVREFVGWAERSPPHATLRRAVRLIGHFTLNGQHLTTAIYHPERTEYRG